jgi:hypothetical protein
MAALLSEEEERDRRTNQLRGTLTTHVDHTRTQVCSSTGRLSESYGTSSPLAVSYLFSVLKSRIPGVYTSQSASNAHTLLALKGSPPRSEQER